MDTKKLAEILNTGGLRPTKMRVREYERFGCPVLEAGGLECISLFRISGRLEMSRKATLQWLAEYDPGPPDYQNSTEAV